MDVANYYITTLSNSLSKIVPLLAFLLAGYFIFIKLPFLFYLKSMKASRPHLDPEVKPSKDDWKKEYNVDDYKDFQRRMRTIQSPKGQEQQQREERKTQEEKPKQKPRPRPKPRISSAEELFELTAGQSFTKEELRKKYHELLRQNHPDKVASLGADFKKLAEVRTKEINSAYSKLKAQAA